MSIATLVTRGYGTFGSIAEVVARGYIDSTAITATIGGLTALTETQVVAGEQTTITLTNDTWVAAGATFDAQRQNIINGDTSDQSELLGWNTIVRDNEPVTSVVRTSDTIVTISWSAAPTYDIAANETRTITIPASALTGGIAVVGSPTVGITADIAVFVEKYHTISFSSVSRNMGFTTTQRKMEFSSASKSIIIEARESPEITELIAKEDGFGLLFENDNTIRRE